MVNQLSWPGQIKEMHHYWQKQIFLYVLVFVSFFFMFHQFGVVPPPFPWSDEASAGQDAVATLNGGFRLHYPDQGGGGNLWVYLATLAFLLLEPNIFALRWLAGVAGLFAVVFFYAAGLELFRIIAPLKKSQWLAFLSALGLAVSTWHLIMSRVAWPPVLGSIAVSAMTFFLWGGLRTKRLQAFVGLGVVVGLSLYLYVPSRLIGLVVIIFLTVESILSLVQHKPIQWWLLRYQFLLTIGVAVIVAAPMLGLYLAYPDTFTTRIEEVRIQTDTSSWLEQVSRNLYFYADSFGFALNLDRLPIDGLILGSITSILFLAGLLIAFWQISTPLSRYVLIWWFLLIIPGVVSPTLAYDPSILRRVIGILPVRVCLPYRLPKRW